MSVFLQKAEEILDVAAGANRANDPDTPVAILMNRQGGMRMLDPTGWSLAALGAEFGAAAVYKVEQQGGTSRVEGWGRGQRCLIQREAGPIRERPAAASGLPALIGFTPSLPPGEWQTSPRL